MEVDGISVAAANAIKDGSIVSGAVNAGTGHLILTKASGATIDAGQVVPANPWTDVLKRKAANTTRASTVALTVDPDLVIDLTPNAVYEIDVAIGVYSTSGTNGGFQIDFNVSGDSILSGGLGFKMPARTDGITMVSAPYISGGTIIDGSSSHYAFAYATLAVDANEQGIWGRFIAHTGATASPKFEVKWAQNSSHATGAILRAGSFARARRIS